MNKFKKTKEGWVIHVDDERACAELKAGKGHVFVEVTTASGARKICAISPSGIVTNHRDGTVTAQFRSLGELAKESPFVQPADAAAAIVASGQNYCGHILNFMQIAGKPTDREAWSLWVKAVEAAIKENPDYLNRLTIERMETRARMVSARVKPGAVLRKLGFEVAGRVALRGNVKINLTPNPHGRLRLSARGANGESCLGNIVELLQKLEGMTTIEAIELCEKVADAATSESPRPAAMRAR